MSNSIGDRWGLGFTHRGLGLIAQAQGEHPQAVEMLRKSRQTFREVGARQDEARVLVEMSRSLFALGNDAGAEDGWREALYITVETQSAFVALEALAGLAGLHAKRGDADRAFELLSVVLSHAASLQDTKERAETLRTELERRWVRPAPDVATTKPFEHVVARAHSSLASATTASSPQQRTSQPPVQSQ